MTAPDTMRCAAHPEVETNLRCGKCSRPICPRCMVQTPVGARCRDCAKLYKLPTFRISTAYYLRAIGTALGMAAATGFIWGIINNHVSFFYLNLLLAAGVGYAIGEVTSLAVNRKRSPWLAVMGGIGVAVSYTVNIFTFGTIPSLDLSLVIALISLGLGVYIVVARLH